MWNTREAHEAMAWATELGAADAFHEAVMKASFVDGLPLVRETYVALANALGLDGADLASALETGRFRERTAAALAEGPALGVSGVPCFVFENDQGFAGAQPREVFEQAFAAYAMVEQADPVGDYYQGGAFCGMEFDGDMGHIWTPE